MLAVPASSQALSPAVSASECVDDTTLTAIQELETSITLAAEALAHVDISPVRVAVADRFTPDMSAKTRFKDPIHYLQWLSSLRGQPVLIYYFKTNSKACEEDIEELNQVQTKYGPRGLRVIGIAVDPDVEAVEDYIAKHKLKYEVVLDPKGVSVQVGIPPALPRLVDDRGERFIESPSSVMIQASGVPLQVMFNGEGTFAHGRLGRVRPRQPSDPIIFPALQDALDRLFPAPPPSFR
jgi:peroxiredoxin